VHILVVAWLKKKKKRVSADSCGVRCPSTTDAAVVSLKSPEKKKKNTSNKGPNQHNAKQKNSKGK
jgi:hypothetical protein